jgi:hypothetical protein
MSGKVMMIHMEYVDSPQFYSSIEELKEKNRWVDDETEETCSDDELYDYFAEWADIYMVNDKGEIEKVQSLD